MKGADAHVGLASIKRRESSLHETLLSLVSQADRISVYLNDYTELSPWMKNPQFDKTEFLLASNCAGDLGDAGKFYAAVESDAQFYLTGDDDIIYPADYVERMTSWSTIHPLSCVHGRIFPDDSTPIRRFFGQMNGVRVLHFADPLTHPTRVHVAGTGTLCFQRERFKIPSRSLFLEERNIADVWISAHSLKQGLPIIAVPRKGKWLKPTVSSRHTPSIFERAKKDFTVRDIFNRELPRCDLRLEG